MTDNSEELLYGASGAAIYLGCTEQTIRTYANAGKLPCARDTGGKRLFRFSDLKKFKRKHGHIGKLRPPEPRVVALRKGDSLSPPRGANGAEGKVSKKIVEKLKVSPVRAAP